MGDAPLAVDRDGPKDFGGHATGASATLGEILLAIYVPDWDVSPKTVPDWPKGSRRSRVNVLTPTGETFLFSMSTCYAEQFIQRKQARWATNKKRVLGIAPIPPPLDLSVQKFPVVAELERGPERIHKSSGGRRVLGYAHKEYFESVAPIWTLDRLPAWARALFLRVVQDVNGCGFASRKVVSHKRQGKVIEMPRRNWRDRAAERIAA